MQPAIKLYEAADEVFWTAKLTAVWWLGVLAGGVVLGVGPATVAAYALTRRRIGHESFQLIPAFVRTYRQEFRRGSLLVLPLLFAGVLLSSNYLYFASFGAGATAPRLAMFVALFALVLIGAYLLPMAVHYDLPIRTCLFKASLFAITRPASTVVLLFTFLVVAFAARTFPLLGLVLAAGGWIRVDTWLCLRFFAENEARLQARGIS